jgi:hypothetical protein
MYSAALGRKVLLGALARGSRLVRELVAQTMEVARGQGFGGFEVEDMRKQREEHSGPHAEVEGDADIVGGPPQEGDVAYAGDIDTIAEDNAENTVASAAPFVEGSIGSLVVASCSVASADKAYRVVDDHQAWASARKACPRSDSYFWGGCGSGCLSVWTTWLVGTQR